MLSKLFAEALMHRFTNNIFIFFSLFLMTEPTSRLLAHTWLQERPVWHATVWRGN